MNQLVLLIPGQPELTRLTISSDDEVKIQALLNQNRLPAVFTLNGTRIVTDTILGFNDNRSLAEVEFPEQVQPTPMTDFFASVRQQEWYQKGLKARNSQNAAASRYA